jgi:hypothetical protein
MKREKLKLGGFSTMVSIPESMKAISLRSPWWWYILYAGKDIENRGFRFPRFHRGRVLLHASKWWNTDEIEFDCEDANDMWAEKPFRTEGAPPLSGDYLKASAGCIVGSVEIVDYVTESSSPWFVGALGIVIRNPVPFVNPVPYKGALGIFNVDVTSEALQEEISPLFAQVA